MRRRGPIRGLRALGLAALTVALTASLAAPLAEGPARLAPSAPPAATGRAASHAGVVASAASASPASTPATPRKRLAASRRPSSDRIPGLVSVVVEPSAVPAIRRRVAALGGTAIVGYGGESLTVRVPERKTAAVRAALASAPGVRDVGDVGRVRALETTADFVPTDPLYPQQWAFPMVNAPEGWGHTRGSASVVVAVIDTGIHAAHPEFAGRVDTTNDHDFANDDANAADDAGHGTHVSGIVAAAMMNGQFGVGTAPGVRILPVKVLDADGLGSTPVLAEGIRWAADHGADVINLSVGGEEDDPSLRSAVAYALSKDCVVVAASGNRGTSDPFYPAAYMGVIGVGAVDPTGALASYSSWGSYVDLVAPGGKLVSVPNPVDEILSTELDGGTGSRAGTSMAAGFVSGAAALLRSLTPSLTYAQVIQLLTDSAYDLGAPDRDEFYGTGLLDIGKALQARPATDDDIPGVFPVLPARGSLDASDVRDVYRVGLGAGERVAVSLVASAGTQFQLRLYGPSAVNVASPPQATAGPGFPAQMVFPASATGDHYLEVRRVSGAGNYSLDYAVGRPAGTDDRIPGVAPVSGTISDSLRDADQDDVFAIPAAAGHVITLRMVASAGSDFDLYLFDPAATDMDDNPYLVRSEDPDFPKTIRVLAPVTGTYFVNVYNRGAAASPPTGGDYSLSWSAGAEGDAETGLTLTSSDPLPLLNQTVTLTAQLRAGGAAVGVGRVYFELWNGAAWGEVASQTVDTLGRAKILAKASAAAEYRVRYDGDPLGLFAPSVSPTLHLWPRTATSLSLTPNTYGPAYGTSARLTARLSNGTRTPSGARIYLQRLSAGTWVAAGEATTVNGICTFSVRPTGATSYRVRFAGDGSLGPSVSPGRVIKPKVYLSTPSAPSATWGSFTATGYLKPRHTAGGRWVQVRLYAYATNPVLKRTVWAKVTNYGTYSRYSVSVTLPYDGRWVLDAYSPTDSQHSWTASPKSRYIFKH